MIFGNLVHYAYNTKKLFSDLNISDIDSLSIKEIKSKKLFEIIQNTTISTSLKNRKSRGSSGMSEQTRMLSVRIKKILSYKKIIKKQNYEIKKSLDSLSKKVKTLTK